MPAETIALHEDQEITLATTLQEIVFGGGVAVVWVSCPADVYVSRDDTKAHGDTISSTKRFRVPAGTVWPIAKSGYKTFVAAVSGTPVASFAGA